MPADLTDKQIADKLFEYVRDVLYNPERATLDADSIPEPFHQLAEGLQFVGECALEQKEFSQKLLKGDLSAEPPSVENGLAAPLKAVQGTLTHMTWQAQEIAKGDYKQHVDFLGELGDAVNTMTQQLDERETALRHQRDHLARINEEMTSLHDLMMDLALGSTRAILFISKETGQTVFGTDAVAAFVKDHSQLSDQILNELVHCPEEAKTSTLEWTRDFYPQSDDKLPPVVRYHIVSRPATWQGEDVIAHIVTNITETMEQEAAMKELAFRDALTGLHNRRYGMEHAQKMIEEKTPFTLSFIDLDNLKYCNDNFGHTEGDIYITQLAAILKSMKGDHIICRIGGDEFMVLTTDTDAKAMTEQLCAMRKNVLELPVPEGYEYHRSFSYGVIDIPAPATKDLEEYLSEADTVMYHFKYENKKFLRIAT